MCNIKFNSISAKAIMLGFLLIFGNAQAQANVTFTNYGNTNFFSNNSAFINGTINAVSEAEAILNNTFTNNININILFNTTTNTSLADEYDVNVGNSQINVSYAQIKNDLQQNALANPGNNVLASIIANLPASFSCPNCANGQNSFYLSNVESKLLTGQYASGFNSTTFDAVIDINPTLTYNFGTTPLQSNQYDLVGTMLHEITHAMGRTAMPSFSTNTNTTINDLSILDLSRYTCGGTSFDFSTNNACFSINGGKTDLNTFSSSSDPADWAYLSSNLKDPFGAYESPGMQTNKLNQADIATMQAIGWATAIVPEPETYTMFTAGLIGLVVVRRKALL